MSRQEWLESEGEFAIDPWGWGLPYPARSTPYVVQWLSRPIDQFVLNPYVAWRALTFFIGNTDITEPIANQLLEENVMVLLVEDYLSANDVFRVILLHPSTSPEEVIRALSISGYGRPDQFTAEMM